MRLQITETPITNLLVIETQVFQDDRGFFMETYSKRDFVQAGITDEFVQENHSKSQKSVLRGLHFQDLRAPMAKLIRCTRGAIIDVAVDLRSKSPTFGKWYSVELSEENKKMLYVPLGFAHGFQTLMDDSEVQYRQTNYYLPEAERSISWDDTDLKVEWPLPNPIISEKDKRAMSFSEYRLNPTFA